jgi:hypothetical protein
MRLREEPVSQILRNVSVDPELRAYAPVMLGVRVTPRKGARRGIAPHGRADQLGDYPDRLFFPRFNWKIAIGWNGHVTVSEGAAHPRRSAHDPAFAKHVSTDLARRESAPVVHEWHV